MAIPPEDSLGDWINWAVVNGEYLNDQDWAYLFADKKYECSMDIARWGMPVTGEGEKLNIVSTRKG